LFLFPLLHVVCACALFALLVLTFCVRAQLW